VGSADVWSEKCSSCTIEISEDSKPPDSEGTLIDDDLIVEISVSSHFFGFLMKLVRVGNYSETSFYRMISLSSRYFK
jgi:hypothetical protein